MEASSGAAGKGAKTNMKRTILVSAVLFITGGIVSAGQTNLESLDLSSLRGDLAKIEVAAPTSVKEATTSPAAQDKPAKESGEKGAIGARRGLSAPAKFLNGANTCYQQALQYVSPPPSAAKLCQGAADTAPVDCYLSAYQEPGVGPSVAFSICIHSPSSNPTGPLECFQSLKPSLGDSTAAVLCRGSEDTEATLACYNGMLAQNSNPRDAAIMCSR